MEALAVEHPQYSGMQPAPEFEPAQPTVNVVAPVPLAESVAANRSALDMPQQVPEFESGALAPSHDSQSRSAELRAGDISQAEQQSVESLQHDGLPDAGSQARSPETDPFAMPVSEPGQMPEHHVSEPEARPQSQDQQPFADPFAMPDAAPVQSPQHHAVDRTAEMDLDAGQSFVEPFAPPVTESLQMSEQQAPLQTVALEPVAAEPTANLSATAMAVQVQVPLAQPAADPVAMQVPASEQNATKHPADPEEFARKLQQAPGPLMSGGQQ